MKHEVIEKRVAIPEKVEVEINNNKILVKASEKSLEKVFDVLGIELAKEGNEIIVKSSEKTKKTVKVINAIIAHINNMFKGVLEGFEYKLAIVSSHFPLSVQPKENVVEIGNFIGERSPRKAKIVGKNTKVEVKGKEVIVRGIDKEAVGQTAANIEKTAKTKARDLRVFQDGVYITKKG